MCRACGLSLSEDLWLANVPECPGPLFRLTPAPKPEEPTGLGAVVEDIHGRRYQRIDRPTACWLRSDIPIDAALDWRDYADIAAVRVLSEGVHP